jgi:hypothetical protein
VHEIYDRSLIARRKEDRERTWMEDKKRLREMEEEF